MGKEQQNSQLRALLLEKKQLVQRLESFLREVEQESARIDQAIAKTTRELAAHKCVSRSVDRYASATGLPVPL